MRGGRRSGLVVMRKLAALLLTVLTLGACRDEVPSEQAIASLLEVSANQELSLAKAAQAAGPNADLIPDAVRIVNLKKLGAVTDSKGIYVASIQFDVMIEHRGTQMLNQRGAKARLKLSRAGDGWQVVEKQ
jgi:hypothetical protein